MSFIGNLLIAFGMLTCIFANAEENVLEFPSILIQELPNSRKIAMPANNDGYVHFGGGAAVGTIVKKPSEKGMFFKTWEMDVNFGEFYGDPGYLSHLDGTSFSWASRREEQTKRLLEEVRNLPLNQTYLLIYDMISPYIPQMEDTHYELTGIIPLMPELTPLIEKEYVVVDESGQSVPSYNYSENGSRAGKIIAVERFGSWRNLCIVTLNMGGLRSGSDGNQGANFMDFAVHSEAGCQHAEKILVTGTTVVVDYSEAYWTWFHGGTDLQIHKFTLEDGTSPVSSEAGFSENLAKVLGVSVDADEETLRTAFQSYVKSLLKQSLVE